MFPVNVQEKFSELFDRHWDSEKMAELYDRQVEGKDSTFGTYIHVGERDATLDVMGTPKPGRFLDCGCGNGRFLLTLPEELLVVAGGRIVEYASYRETKRLVPPPSVL